MKTALKILSTFALTGTLLSLPPFTAGAEDWIAESPIREENETLEEALTRTAVSLPILDRTTWATPITPANRAKYYGNPIDYSALPQWTSGEDELDEAFARARDERIYIEKKRPNFKRRSSWLFPDDGCYARAWHIASSFRRNGWTAPGKLFAFGELRLRTSYHPKGRVYWWYHTAAAFRYGTQVLVLDPSVSLSRPLRLSQWLALISASPNKVRLSACDPYSYSPRTSRCVGGGSGQESSARSHQIGMLSREWSRLLQLRMNPNQLLGPNPPWDLTFIEPTFDFASVSIQPRASIGNQ